MVELAVLLIIAAPVLLLCLVICLFAALGAMEILTGGRK